MSTTMRAVSAAVVVACLAVTPSTHGALLEGQTIAAYHLQQIVPDTTTVIGPVTVVVGPAVEYVDFGWGGFVDIDVSDTSILITLKTDQPPAFTNALVFTDAKGTIGDFTGVTVNPSTSYAGFDQSRVAVAANAITLSLTGLRGLRGQQISLNVSGSSGPPPLQISVDVQPSRCINRLRSTRIVPVAIRGSESVDVSRIDPASIRLQGVAPLRSRIVDMAGSTCASSTDGVPDLVLRFSADEVIAALAPVADGDIRVLSLTGELKEEFGATPIRGEDSVTVRIITATKQ